MLGKVTSAKFKLQLLGGFSLRGPEGATIDIPSKKGRALLAMLATAENGERTRSWLQDHLWSRGSSQDSLRKELSSLRNLLGSFDLDPLPKDVPRDVVRLKLECLDIDTQDGQLKAKREFLEGLDIPYENTFEEWLRETRGYFASLTADTPKYSDVSEEVAGSVSPPNICLGISPVIWDTNYVGDRKEVILNDVLDRVARSLMASGGIELFDHRFSAPGSNVLSASVNQDPKVLLIPRVATTSSHFVMSLELILSETNQVLCARRNEWDLGKVDSILADYDVTTQLVAETVDEILFTLSRHAQKLLSKDTFSALKLVNNAIGGIFELSYKGLDRAQSSLDRAVEMYPESVIYAWRAYLSTQQVDDPRIVDFKPIQDEARYYAARALELDRYNPLVLSLLTHVHAFTLREFDIASDYMHQAKALYSDHVMTYDSDALLNLYLGNLTQSRESALRAIRLSRFLPFKYIFITTLCMIDAHAGDYASSITTGEKSLQLQPAGSERPYPPTIRYLAESYARLGEKEKASELIRRLNHADINYGRISQRVFPTGQIENFLTAARSGNRLNA